MPHIVQHIVEGESGRSLSTKSLQKAPISYESLHYAANFVTS